MAPHSEPLDAAEMPGGIPLRFRGIARSAVDFFLRRGLSFSDEAGLYQSIFIAFYSALGHDRDTTDYELGQIGRRIAARHQKQDRAAGRLKQELREATLTELSAVGNTFGSRLKASRLFCDLTQGKLAGQMGISESAISYWESDVQLPDPPNLKKLAGILGASAAYLLCGLTEDELMAWSVEDESSETERKILGYKLMVMRYTRGLYVQDVISICGLDFQTISNAESGLTKVSARALKTVADVLGSTVSVLLAGKCRGDLMARRADDERSEDTRHLLGLKLKVLRYEKGMSRTELSQVTGLASSTILKNETGQRFPLAPQLKILANHLGTTASQLLAGMPFTELMDLPLPPDLNDDKRNTLGLKLTVARYEKGLPSKVVAGMATIKPQSLSGIEHGEQLPKLDTLFLICTALELDSGKLLRMAGR